MSLFWVVLKFQGYSVELAGLVYPNVPIDYLAQFFWEHLQRDMEVLSKSLNLNNDDTALIVHSILKHISQLQDYPGNVYTVNNW